MFRTVLFRSQAMSQQDLTYLCIFVSVQNHCLASNLVNSSCSTSITHPIERYIKTHSNSLLVIPINTHSQFKSQQPRMGRCTYIIDTTLRCEGKTYQVHYCPWGRGRRCWDNVTSFKQYKCELQEHLTSCDVKLYTIDECGKAVSITDDSSLCKAVRCLPQGGELCIIAIKCSESESDSECGPDDCTDSEWDNCPDFGSDSCSDSEIGSNCPNPYGPFKNDVKEVMKKFDVPGCLKCYYDCNRELRGTRYVWKYNHDYAICYSCWKRLRSSKKEKWIKCNEGGAPWDGEVPDAPLYFEFCRADREDVRHLNYVLCRLGFISLRAFRRTNTAEFTLYTKAAVCLFRKKYRICGRDMGVYNEATEKKMEELVHRFRHDGAQYI